MKKILITVMSFLLVFTLVACGTNTSQNKTSNKPKIVKIAQPQPIKGAAFEQADTVGQYRLLSDTYNAVNSSYLNYLAAYTQLVQDNMTPASVAQLQNATPHLAALIDTNKQVIASAHKYGQLTKFKAAEADWYQAEMTLQQVTEQELTTLQAVTGTNTKHEGDVLDQLHAQLQTADYATQQAEYKAAVQAGLPTQQASQHVEEQRQRMNAKYRAPLN
ncbi:hypothetical protein EQG49_07495 [Periweissella cryptocerci]|uniref:Uncharacterized protein n=1 Tax=Periweissella cryptocerci TaxID=2506420 RepID=A0A4P6YUC1_9LACO|nr:hypothetical protein [Periweissella cryptocerci]QBO36311.1 hypothetical protein EQG49_07495 [Periweissella cryptocerci]